MRHNRRSTPRVQIAVLALAVALTGCFSTSPPAVEWEPLPAAFDDGVPAPTGEVVLSVEVDGTTHEWDLAALEALEQHDLTIIEPFIEEERTYTGPLWGDVLRASGVDLDEAHVAELVALDDFVADIPVEDDTLDGLLLARLEDGAVIPLEAGGPIRLVYPPDNPTGENANNWIWSIRRATVT